MSYLTHKEHLKLEKCTVQILISAFQFNMSIFFLGGGESNLIKGGKAVNQKPIAYAAVSTENRPKSAS